MRKICSIEQNFLSRCLDKMCHFKSRKEQVEFDMDPPILIQYHEKILKIISLVPSGEMISNNILIKLTTPRTQNQHTFSVLHGQMASTNSGHHCSSSVQGKEEEMGWGGEGKEGKGKFYFFFICLYIFFFCIFISIDNTCFIFYFIFYCYFSIYNTYSI